MHNYTIVLTGRGSEFYTHSITNDQREKLEHLNLNECSLEDVADILEMQDFDELLNTERTFLGSIPENSEITVFDGENQTIYKENVQDILFQELNNPDSKMEDLYQHDILYVDDNIKGTFFEITIQDEEEFNISKLNINITDIEGQDYITSIEYKGNEGEFGSYWSKGIHFFLSHE
jgi:hypothetical protein